MIEIAASLLWLMPLSGFALAVSILASGRVGSWLRIRRSVAATLLLSLGVFLAGTLSPLAAPEVIPPGIPRTCDLTRTWLATPIDLASGNDVVVNILMLMPLGFTVGTVPLSRRKVALVVGSLALPFVIEALQLLVVPLGRGCESADVVDNLTGLFIGLVAGTPLSWLVPQRRRLRRGSTARGSG